MDTANRRLLIARILIAYHGPTPREVGTVDHILADSRVASAFEALEGTGGQEECQA